MLKGLLISFLLFLGGGQINPGGGGGAPTTCTSANNYPCLNTANTFTAVNTITSTTSGSFVTTLEQLDSSLTTGQCLQHGIGHDGTTNHEGFLIFCYDSGTANNNALKLGLFGISANLVINPNVVSTPVPFSALSFNTTSNCANTAAPAVCGSATSGAVVIAASATTVVVNTNQVTANSQIQVTPDSSLGTRLSVTCNTTIPVTSVSARTAGTSFTITAASAPTTNPLCLNFTVIN